MSMSLMPKLYDQLTSRDATKTWFNIPWKRFEDYCEQGFESMNHGEESSQNNVPKHWIHVLWRDLHWCVVIKTRIRIPWQKLNQFGRGGKASNCRSWKRKTYNTRFLCPCWRQTLRRSDVRDARYVRDHVTYLPKHWMARTRDTLLWQAAVTCTLARAWRFIYLFIFSGMMNRAVQEWCTGLSTWHPSHDISNHRRFDYPSELLRCEETLLSLLAVVLKCWMTFTP